MDEIPPAEVNHRIAKLTQQLAIGDRTIASSPRASRAFFMGLAVGLRLALEEPDIAKAYNEAIYLEDASPTFLITFEQVLGDSVDVLAEGKVRR